MELVVLVLITLDVAVGVDAAGTDSLTAPIRIGTSTASDGQTLGIPRWKAYMLETDPNQFWACYANGARSLSNISYTTDGGNTWSREAIQIEPAGYLDMHCSVFGRDGDLYATWPGLSSTTFRRFSAPIHSNADGGPLVSIAGTTASHISNIMVQNTGRIWLFTRLSYASPSENVLYHYSDNNGSTWNNGVAYATSSATVRMGSMPYAEGNPALVVLYLDDSRGFEYYLWNGSTFEARSDHSIYAANMGQERVFSHNQIRDSVFHLTFGVGTQLHHVWKNFNNGTGSWSHEIIDTCANNNAINLWFPTTTVRGDDLYLFYCKRLSADPTSSLVYYKKWSQTDLTWTAPELVTTGPANVSNRDPNGPFQVPDNSPYVPVIWRSGAGTFDINFAKVVISGDTTVPVTTFNLEMESLPSIGGTTSPPTGSSVYPENSNVSITAAASSGYVFTSWSGEVDDPFSQSTALVMNSDKSIAANFAEVSGTGGSVYGLVRAGSTGLRGVYVDLRHAGGGLLTRAISDPSGYYSMLSVPAGSYTLTVQMPMGFGPTASSEIPVTITDAPVEANVLLENVASGSITDFWWWSRQLEAINSGSPLANGITRADVDAYGQEIFQSYYAREDGQQIRIQYVTYTGDPPRPLTCQDIIDLWNTLVDDSNQAKAREHLLCCMLNVAANRMGQLRVVTSDGATASQTIRHYADWYLAGGATNYLFWYNLMKVHMSQMVPAGIVPLATPNIMYGGSGEIDRPPVISCPSEPVAVSVCGASQACVALAIQDYGAVTIVPSSATWSGGQLCFDAPGVGAYSFHVTAAGTDATFSPAECDLTVNVGLTAPPEITCPTDTLEIFSCNPGQICIELPVANAATVSVSGATWADNQLCFAADTAGLYTFSIAAANSCASVVCSPAIRVTLGHDVTIVCEADTLSTYLCTAGSVCIDMAIANQTNVEVVGAVWIEDQLCFQADTAGLYTYTVTAFNGCDTAVCEPAVRVTINPIVAITCQAEPVQIAVCYPETVCLPLPVVNQDSVTVEGATWADGQLCFAVDTSGFYQHSVTASNGCGSVACEIGAQVTIGPSIDLYLTTDELSLSPTAAVPGEMVTVSARIHSDPSSLVGAAVVVRVYEGDPSDGGIPVSEGISDALDPGETVEYAIAFEVQNPSPQEVFVVIDPDNELSECDEGNNRASAIIHAGLSEGTVRGVVSLSGAGMLGVPVALLDDGSNPIREVYSDVAGAYLMEGLAGGIYLVEITVPLGFSPLTPAAVPVSISGGEILVNFTLGSAASGSVTDWWWWQRQLAAIRAGTPLYLGITRTEVETSSQLIFDHFYDRDDGYAIMIAGCTYNGNPVRPLTFEEIAYIFLDAHDDTAPGKARAYLLTCLLNIASNRLSQMRVVSADGATASQAITYFASQYLYGNPNDWTLWYNLMKIHTSQIIAAGIIPLSTPRVMFKPSEENWNNLPGEFSLSQNYPNPFNPTTNIKFTLPAASPVRLEVFDVIGRRVAVLLDQVLEAGEHEVQWDASEAASGVYVYRLTVSDFVDTKKMLLLK